MIMYAHYSGSNPDLLLSSGTTDQESILANDLCLPNLSFSKALFPNTYGLEETNVQVRW
jgi:hypothetical protein